MAIAHSIVSSQGRVTIPSAIRRHLGVGPGSVVEWLEENGGIVIRRVERYTCEDIHRRLFPERQSGVAVPIDKKAAITRYVKKRHVHRAR